MAPDKSLAAEIEAKTVRARAGLALADDILTELYSDWTPEAGAQFTDRGAAEAIEGIRLAREVLAEIAALQSRAFEDGARWMRERAYNAVIDVRHAAACNFSPEFSGAQGEARTNSLATAAKAVLALPLQPEGEWNA